jgi:hypothetical protein
MHIHPLRPRLPRLFSPLPHLHLRPLFRSIQFTRFGQSQEERM